MRTLIAKAMIVVVLAASGALCGAMVRPPDADPHSCCPNKEKSKPDPDRCCLMTSRSPKANVAVEKASSTEIGLVEVPVFLVPPVAARVEADAAGIEPGWRVYLFQILRL